MRVKSLALLMSVIMVLLMGTMHVSMAAHAVDHDHHSAATHSTGICAWMCTAAQSVSPDSPAFHTEFHLLGFLKETPFRQTIPDWALLIPSRGPPR